MAKVKKANRVLTVDESVVESYLKDGYDQIDEKGEVVKRATGGRTVSLAEHNKVLDELEGLKKQIELSKLGVDELKTKLDETKIAYTANDSKEALITKLIKKLLEGSK